MQRTPAENHAEYSKGGPPLTPPPGPATGSHRRGLPMCPCNPPPPPTLPARRNPCGGSKGGASFCPRLGTGDGLPSDGAASCHGSAPLTPCASRRVIFARSSRYLFWPTKKPMRCVTILMLSRNVRSSLSV